ncbi:hypothetical protein CAL7716_101010 (plasmid) [Calothrix sp. PCC 7716]|nr:hypothetical protein CAL7716_101010 [Calothrix sp. PCC 7716]
MKLQGIVLILLLLIGRILFKISVSKFRNLEKIKLLRMDTSKEVKKEDLSIKVPNNSPLEEGNSNIKDVDLIESNTPSIENEELLEPETIPQESSKCEEIIRFAGNYKLKIRSFRIPKDGFTEDECEDNSAISSESSETVRIAVSDGATEGIFSSIWSELLVNKYVEAGSQIFVPSQLNFVHDEFVLKAFQNISNMPETRHWFMYEKLDRGTHATMATVEFSNSNTIQISTIGDSCIFWYNQNEIGMLPELSSNDFASFPNTICHSPNTWQNIDNKLVKKEILIDNFFQISLCTDALACWLVKRLKEQNELLNWSKIFEISCLSSFKEFIQELRARKEIRNDDVTLVLIDVLPLNV